MNDERYMWRYELQPPHLINVATQPCESRNSKNVILQWDITKENCIKRIVYASSKWTCTLQNLGCYATMHVGNKDLWHLWPAKMLEANLGWLWTERYRGWDWPVARQSEIMYACWWRTLWTHAAKLFSICIMWFIRTFCETINVIWCIWRLFSS